MSKQKRFATAFLLDYEMSFEERISFMSDIPRKTEFHNLYAKIGPCRVGDARYPVKKGQTIIEVFSPEDEIAIREKYPDAKPITIIWDDSLTDKQLRDIHDKDLYPKRIMDLMERFDYPNIQKIRRSRKTRFSPKLILLWRMWKTTYNK